MNIVTAVFTVCIFVGSFLLFLIQPMVGKILLPYLGGAAAVWTTCMLFFQLALLAGYVYAEKSIRYLGCQRQSILHLLLMTGAFILLPLHVDTAGAELAAARPTGWLLARLAGSIGFLFFMISANAPLLQRYYSETGQPDSADPYFLYAASNVGSLLALIAYPFLFEPLLRLSEQRVLWSAIYILQTLLVLCCCIFLWKAKRTDPGDQTDADKVAENPAATEHSADVEFTNVDDFFNRLVQEHKQTEPAVIDPTRPTWKKALFQTYSWPKKNNPQVKSVS